MGYFLSRYYDDLRIPTEWERQKLCEMLWRAFIEIRILALRGESERIAELTDAFHNLPELLYSENFSMKYFRMFLEGYHSKYPKNETGGDFLEMLDNPTTRLIKHLRTH